MPRFLALLSILFVLKYISKHLTYPVVLSDIDEPQYAMVCHAKLASSLLNVVVTTE